MIVTKTPLRISFFSGGSDIPAYHKDNRLGASLSSTIDKYVYVTLHPNHNEEIVTKFDTVEYSNINNMKHEITKNSLLFHKLNEGLTISSLADIPLGGSGLGSSSAFTVGLLGAIAEYKRIPLYYAGRVARDACHVEIEMCGFPIGKQDQYAAAQGGFNLFSYRNDIVEQIEDSVRNVRALEDRLLLYYTGTSRNGNVILKHQKEGIENDKKVQRLVEKNVCRAFDGYRFIDSNQLDDFGNLLHESWMDKKNLADGITNDYIDSIYHAAMIEGSHGGKVLGAGGGGFMLFYATNEDIKNGIRHSMQQFPLMKEFPFSFVQQGSRMICND